MPDFQRVKDNETKHEYSARRPNPAKVTIIDKPAVDADGRPLPAKPHVAVTAKKSAAKPESEGAGKVE